MTPERTAKFRRVVNNRQPDLTVVLENVHDPHNIAAVLRSCDSVGIREIYVLYTEPQLQTRSLIIGKRTSAGTRKWVDIHLFNDAPSCFEEIRKKYTHILGTHLSTEAKPLFQLDLTRPTALVFGNEHDGLSREALSYCTGNFIIPQAGMVESLNISVACAVTLYEAYRQRLEKGFYAPPFRMKAEEREKMFEEYAKRSEKGVENKKIREE